MHNLSLGLLFVTFVVTAGSTGAAQRSGSTIPTSRIFEALDIRAGIVVCEMGAGDGELSIAAARLTGPSGRVYTSELGEERLRTLRANTQKSDLKQITVVEADPVKTNLPDGGCDALFMRNVYHHFADPAVINASILRSLKAGGRVAIVDFTPPAMEAATPADRSKDGTHGVLAETVARELTSAGFEQVTVDPGKEGWFLVSARRPGQ